MRSNEIDNDGVDYTDRRFNAIRRNIRIYDNIKAAMAKFTTSFDDLEHMGCKHPLLSKEEEIELGKKIKKGDLEARNKLVTHNMRLVSSIAKRYANTYADMDECICIGSIGLIEAAGRFDPDKGFRFSTYATHYIKMRLWKNVNDNTASCVHVPKYHYVIAKNLRLGKPVSNSQLEVYKTGQMAFNTPRNVYDLEENNDDQALELRPEYEPRFLPQDYVLLEVALSKLSDRDRTIIEARNGLGKYDGRIVTLQETGELIVPKISKERVRQLQSRAMERLIDILIPLRVKSHEEVA